MSVLENHNVRVVGSSTPQDKPCVVLAHGFGADQTTWHHIVPHLTADYAVILFDLMGAGSTDPELFDFQRYSDVSAYSHDLIAILDALGVRKCIYVGHSMSCMIGCIASIVRPSLFQKLILLGGSPRYINADDYEGGFAQQDLDELFLAMDTNFRDWVAGFAPLMVGADLESETVKEFSRTFFQLRPDIALHVARTVFGSDLRAVLPQVIVPCHVLQSTQDLAVPMSAANYMHKHLGGKSVIEILRTQGHLPHLSAPDVVAPALKRHLQMDL